MMHFDLIRSFREKMAQGSVIGPFSKTMDPAFIETMGYAGFDFVILDMEHGPNNTATLQNLVCAATTSGIMPIVRTPENSLQSAAASLDIGAGGVQIPQIEDAESVRAVIDACRFAPLGKRGVCRFVRNAGYSSLDKSEYFRKANESIIIVQLEGLKALENINSIIEVPGIDIIFVGPYDLSQSLGVTGQVNHPKVMGAIREIAQKCSEKGIATGSFVETVEQTWLLRELGMKYMCYSVDVGLFYQTCKEQVDNIRMSGKVAAATI